MSRIAFAQRGLILAISAGMLSGCSELVEHFAHQENQQALASKCKKEQYGWKCDPSPEEKVRGFTLNALREERCNTNPQECDKSLDSKSDKSKPAQHREPLPAVAPEKGSKQKSADKKWELAPAAAPVSGGVDVRSVIGGKGAGLNCSIPALAGKWLIDPIQEKNNKQNQGDEANKPRSPVSLQYAQACTTHDFCYRHGMATYGYAQEDCDDMLFDQAYRICAAVYVNGIDKCHLQASLVRMGVRLFGKSAFQGLGESTYFEFDPMARGARKPFSVARIVKNDSDSKQTLHTFFLTREKFSQSTDRGDISFNMKANGGVTTLAPPLIGFAAGKHFGNARFWLVRRNALKDTGFDVSTLKETSHAQAPPFSATVHEKKLGHFECNAPSIFGVTDEFGFSLVTVNVNDDKNALPHTRCPPEISLSDGTETSTIVPLHSVKGKNLLEHNWYRLMDQPVLSGNFEKDQSSLIFLARGYYPGEKDKEIAHQGADFERKTALISITKNVTYSYAKPTVSVADIGQEENPIAAFRPVDKSADILVSVVSPLNRHAICISHWRRNGNSWQAVHCQPPADPPIDSSWVQMPVQVVRTPAGYDELVFTRVCLQPREYCSMHFQQQWMDVRKGRFDPKLVFLSTQAWRFSGAKWERSGLSSEEKIDLTPLTKTLITTSPTSTEKDAFLKSRIALTPALAGNFLKAIRVCKDADAADPSCAQARRLAALLWYSSQAIPSFGQGPGSPASITTYFVPHPLAQFYETVSLKK